MPWDSVKAVFSLQDPRLRITIDALQKRIYRGSYFRAKVVFRNVNRDTAVRAQPCAITPRGIRIIKRDGGKQKDRRVCWPKRNLNPGDGVRYYLFLRGIKTGKKTLRAQGRAQNAPAVRDSDALSIIKRPLPHLPTG